MKEIQIYNLENCIASIKNGLYGGTGGSKDGIIIGNDKWMVKYPKTTKSMNGVNDTSYTPSPICEYLGSHVYQILGYETQKGRAGSCRIYACRGKRHSAQIAAALRCFFFLLQ